MPFWSFLCEKLLSTNPDSLMDMNNLDVIKHVLMYMHSTIVGTVVDVKWDRGMLQVYAMQAGPDSPVLINGCIHSPTNNAWWLWAPLFALLWSLSRRVAPQAISQCTHLSGQYPRNNGCGLESYIIDCTHLTLFLPTRVGVCSCGQTQGCAYLLPSPVLWTWS